MADEGGVSGAEIDASDPALARQRQPRALHPSTALLVGSVGLLIGAVTTSILAARRRKS